MPSLFKRPLFWFYVLWTMLWRVGEAATPGPEDRLVFDRFDWVMGNSTGEAMGVCNPSGVNCRLDQFASFPAGWFGVAETHATLAQQKAFNRAVRGTSSKDGFRAVHGHPAPLRTGSNDTGSWTGVLQFSSSPLRPVTLPWPGGEYDSSRLVCAMGRLGTLLVLNTVIYLPPRGPTFPHAKELGEEFLSEVTREIVYGKGGCRVIMGDFNAPAGSFQAQRLWQEAGWRELQDELHHRHGKLPRATCKSSTRPDQIWASPELLRFFRDVGFIDLFPDHLMMVGSFDVPQQPELERFWQMPERLPWYDVDRNKLAETFEEGSEFQWSDQPTEDFKSWCRRFETRVAHSVQDPQSFRDSSRGRGVVLKPRSRLQQLGVPKGSRQNEECIVDSLLGRSAQLWFQQMRRMQSLKHSMQANRQHPDACQYRHQLWLAILRAKGFRGGFPRWWLGRKIKSQGVVDSLPPGLPSFENFETIYLDFQKNYQGYVAWQRAQKKRLIDAKWKANADACYQLVRPERKKPFDSLVDEHSQPIRVVDGSRQIIQVPSLFPDAGHMAWTLNGEPANVIRVTEGYQVESDLLLVDGQVLCCHVMVSETEVIHQRLLDLWNSRWSKHQGVPDERWEQISAFASAHIGGPACPTPQITYETWIAAVKSYKVTSARGPDGWAREDLLHMPRSGVEELLSMLKRIEAGGDWPVQLQQALIHCLEKTDAAHTVGHYRPITLMSLIYRVWAGLHASGILRHLSSLCESLQCGFIEGGSASDIWYWVQTAIESAISSSTPACGVVGDLVKAYNTLPRKPVWDFLQLLGIHPSFLQCWQRHLSGLQRRFVVRKSCSEIAASVTGFPEGCPLSCAGMAALDVVWHAFQKAYAGNTRALSFVDNLELFSDNVGSLLRSLETMRQFCSLLDLELDEKKLYGWSTTTFGRKQLAAEGITISYGERDLGGQMNYGSKLHNKVLVDRISSLQPLFAALGRSSLMVVQKIKCISGALWPRGLHGCESVELGPQHIRSLRTGAMKALKWSRAGASPLIRLGLVYAAKLDPGYYQFWRSVALFHRQCRHSYEIRCHWKAFCTGDAKQQSHGPFRKLQGLFLQVGRNLDEHLTLHLPEGIALQLLAYPLEGLRRLALFHWRQSISTFVCQRRELCDLNGYDPSHVEAIDAKLEPAQRETLNVVRDGAFFTGDYIGKFSSQQNTCNLCGVDDSREHRYLFCAKYSDLRHDYPELQDGAPGLTSAMVLHGLPGRNPFHAVYWQALDALALVPIQFHVVPPPTGVWHVFTDGSGSRGTTPEVSLAAWALYLADESACIGAGWLPGLDQSVPRAELFAVLQTLHWIGEEEGELHIWSDCLHIIETFRCIQINGQAPCDLANFDLWAELEALLVLKRCAVFIHKVPSHVATSEAISPLKNGLSLVMPKLIVLLNSSMKCALHGSKGSMIVTMNGGGQRDFSWNV